MYPSFIFNNCKNGLNYFFDVFWRASKNSIALLEIMLNWRNIICNPGVPQAKGFKITVRRESARLGYNNNFEDLMALIRL